MIGIFQQVCVVLHDRDGDHHGPRGKMQHCVGTVFCARSLVAKHLGVLCFALRLLRVAKEQKTRRWSEKETLLEASGSASSSCGSSTRRRRESMSEGEPRRCSAAPCLCRP